MEVLSQYCPNLRYRVARYSKTRTKIKHRTQHKVKIYVRNFNFLPKLYSL